MLEPLPAPEEERPPKSRVLHFIVATLTLIGGTATATYLGKMLMQ